MLRRSNPWLQCITIALLHCSIAGAHVERYPKRDALTIAPTGLRLTVDYLVPSGDVALALRKIFDRDHSGALDDGERAALREHLAKEATVFLRVSLDGRDVKLEPRTTIADVSGAEDERMTVHVELAATQQIAEGDHRVLVSDHHKDRRIAVPLRVTLAAGVRWKSRPPLLITVDGAHDAELAVVVTRP